MTKHDTHTHTHTHTVFGIGFCPFADGQAILFYAKMHKLSTYDYTFNSATFMVLKAGTINPAVGIIPSYHRR